MATIDEATLARARDGDETAFAELVRHHEPELHRHCYRLLGSLHAAEDALQETLVSAWSALPAFEGRSSLRTWLYRIATSRCLNAIRDGARRPPVAPVPPFEPPGPTSTEQVTWVQPYPDHLLGDPAAQATERAGIELAFVTALQSLPPRQAAVLVLCDVLGFSQGEAAQMVDATPTAAKGLLQRARAAMPPAEPTAPDDQERHLASRLADAYSRDDVDALVALLTDASWLAMPPAPHRYDGRAAIAEFLRASAAGRGRYELTPTRAGGHPAWICLLDGRARGLLVVTVSADGSAVRSIHRFLDDDLHRWFV